MSFHELVTVAEKIENTVQLVKMCECIPTALTHRFSEASVLTERMIMSARKLVVQPR